MAAWVGPTVAISLAIIALCVLALVLVLIATFRSVRSEINALVRTSSGVRHELSAGVRQTKKRLADFDALVEVMNEEVEDAALDLAVALRTVRSTRSMIGGVKRFLVRGRRDD